jgi:hypothetical protein
VRSVSFCICLLAAPVCLYSLTRVTTRDYAYMISSDVQKTFSF